MTIAIINISLAKLHPPQPLATPTTTLATPTAISCHTHHNLLPHLPQPLVTPNTTLATPTYSPTHLQPLPLSTYIYTVAITKVSVSITLTAIPLVPEANERTAN